MVSMCRFFSTKTNKNYFTERFVLLKTNHEKEVDFNKTLFEKHNKELQRIENIEKENLDKQCRDSDEIKMNTKDTSNHIMSHISEISANIHDLITIKELEVLERHKKTCDEINDKFRDHDTKHKMEDDAIKKSMVAIDTLSEHVEAEFKQMKEKQCNNEQVHQRQKEHMVKFEKTTDLVHEKIRQNIKVKLVK